jgi:hypothetical protein
MGRYYGGDIAGKFWFAVQNSCDARYFGAEPSDPKILYSSCMEECLQNTDLGDPCPECSSDEHCEAMERNEVEFLFDTNHMETVQKTLNNLTEQLLAITPRFTEVLQKVEDDQDWKREGYSDDNWVEHMVDDAMMDVAKSLLDDQEFYVLAARYFLGTQIHRCLKRKGSCWFWCEL